MTKTVKRNVVVSAILAIMLCISLIAGATFALFTSKSKVNIAVSSGKVSVTASIDNASVQTKQLYDTNYTQGADNMYEGVATFDENGLTLEKLVPGDGIQFNIVVENESSVTVQYRTIITCENDNGLFAALNVSIGDKLGYNGVTFVSDWAQLAVGAADAIVPVTIELPEDSGDEYQDKDCTVSYKVEAVQGNAQVENPAAGTVYIYNKIDMMALSGKYLVSNNGVAEVATIELMNSIDLNGAEFKEIGVAYDDTLNFKGNGHTISNMKLVTGGHNGMTNVGMFYVDTGATLNVENLKLVAPIVEDASDEYATGAAAVVGYANGAVNLTNVDVESAKINNTFGNAAVYAGYSVNVLNLVDCNILGADTTISGEVEAGVVRMDKTGAFVGTANTASCVVTLTNCTNASAYNIAGRVIYNAALTVDGAHYVTTASAFKSLMNGSESNVKIILADGKYENVLTSSNKTISVVGENEGGAEIALTNAVGASHDHLGLGGCTVTLENVKATFEDGAYYAAYINGPTMTYKNCTIIGQQYLYGDVSFIKCVFDNDDDAAVSAMRYTYIYDGDVLVDDCDFYTQGHGLIMYSDNGGAGDQTLTVKNSRFHGGQGRTAGAVANQNTAAIEIDGSCGANYTLILEGTNTFDEGFSGLWRIKAMKDGVKTTVSGVEYTGGTDTIYKDGVKYYKDANKNVYAYDGDFVLVETAAALQFFVDKATNQNFNKIKFAADIAGDITITQKPDVVLTIDGDTYRYNGAITIDGKSARYASAGVVIQNVNFNAENVTKDACINLGVSRDNNTRYTNNVTVKKCTFSGTNEKVAVKSYTGGDWNLTLDTCTVNTGMHSLLQVTNVEQGLKIIDCKAYSKNGINLNNTPALEMSGCTFDVQGYAIRFGVNGTVNSEQKTFMITDSALKSACAESDDAVIVFRDSSTNAKLTLKNTTLSGSVDYLGKTDQTDVEEI